MLFVVGKTEIQTNLFGIRLSPTRPDKIWYPKWEIEGKEHMDAITETLQYGLIGLFLGFSVAIKNARRGEAHKIDCVELLIGTTSYHVPKIFVQELKEENEQK